DRTDVVLEPYEGVLDHGGGRGEEVVLEGDPHRLDQRPRHHRREEQHVGQRQQQPQRLGSEDAAERLTGAPWPRGSVVGGARHDQPWTSWSIFSAAAWSALSTGSLPKITDAEY